MLGLNVKINLSLPVLFFCISAILIDLFVRVIPSIDATTESKINGSYQNISVDIDRTTKEIYEDFISKFEPTEVEVQEPASEQVVDEEVQETNILSTEEGVFQLIGVLSKNNEDYVILKKIKGSSNASDKKSIDEGFKMLSKLDKIGSYKVIDISSYSAVLLHDNGSEKKLDIFDTNIELLE